MLPLLAINLYSVYCREISQSDLSTPLDIDECAMGTDSCDENADCDNAIGNYTCTCQSGYSGNGTVCEG